MKKRFLWAALGIVFALLFTTGCQKETQEDNPQTTPVAAENGIVPTIPNDPAGCRMTMYDFNNSIYGYHVADYFTYTNGLVDEWTTQYGWVEKMEYDSNGKMKKARVYENGILLYTVVFVYRNNKVVKELWYKENTTTLDEVTNTYNAKGQMIKNESAAYNYHTLYSYEANGGLKRWELYSGGMMVVSGDYTYHQHYKNPFRSAKGIEYAFAYTNAGIYSTPIWPASEKWTYYDEEGNAYVQYDLDPAKTIWHPAQQNYPQQVEYTDILTGGALIATFAYENCGSENKTTKSTVFAHPLPKTSIQPMLFLNGHAAKSLKEQLKELREQLKK
ncbi:MAG TPA: hypothetical protein VMZ03_04340 [Chitinophagaceae bacterium]|nr:hypothetical protein [Chitinophagaceae bacterium]